MGAGGRDYSQQSAEAHFVGALLVEAEAEAEAEALGLLKVE